MPGELDDPWELRMWWNEAKNCWSLDVNRNVVHIKSKALDEANHRWQKMYDDMDRLGLINHEEDALPC